MALVIGNATYTVGRLNNPVLDARAMTQALRGLGFEVLAHENLNYQSMRRAIAGFGERIAGGGVALVYYSGHGLQVNGRNYLVPVDADIKSEGYVSAEAVDVDSVLAQMQDAKTRVNIVILDACRDNPFARRFRGGTRGLAFMDAPTGTYVAYATAPGSVAEDGEPGKNGVYTGELVRVLREPGLKIEDVFKRVRAGVQTQTKGRQNPWDASSLTGDFFFYQTGPVASARQSDREGGQREQTDRKAEQQQREQLAALQAEQEKLREELAETRRLEQDRRRADAEREARLQHERELKRFEGVWTVTKTAQLRSTKDNPYNQTLMLTLVLRVEGTSVRGYAEQSIVNRFQSTTLKWLGCSGDVAHGKMRKPLEGTISDEGIVRFTASPGDIVEVACEDGLKRALDAQASRTTHNTGRLSADGFSLTMDRKWSEQFGGGEFVLRRTR